MGLFESFKPVRYRIRIFDNDNFLMSAEVPDKGQRRIEVVVHKKLIGGEKVKLAFMLNPKIRPKIFQGKIFEVDFDIRDSTQLGDLFDIAPDIVRDLNESLYNKLKNKQDKDDGVVNADFTIKASDPDIANTADDPLFQENDIDPEPSEDARVIDTILETTKDTIGAVKGVSQFKKSEGKDRQQLAQDLLLLARKHPKILYWLPDMLDIGPEIKALVSQSKIYRVGIQSSYYIAQSNALISEKTLTRPKEQKGMWDAIMPIAVIGIIGVVLIVVVFFLTHSG